MDRVHLVAGAANRPAWEFNYTGQVIANAAVEQRDYRRSRVSVWEDQKIIVMKEIRETGLTITDSEAEKLSSMSYTTSNRGGHGPRVVIDDGMQERLTECQQKIDEHRGLVKQYEAWIQVLEANPHQVLKLTHADWMFFFGK